MIFLYTGEPGAGKTQFGLRQAMEFKQQGRPVYAANVTGLDYVKTGFFPCDDPTAWESLPDGSVLLVDEAYKYAPQRDYRKPVPEWIQKLATHRHRGFDIIFLCQEASQIDVWIRRLVGRHFHVRAKTKRRSLVLSWDRFEDKPKDFLRQRTAQKSLRKLDKEAWTWYSSATVHTHRHGLPWQVYALGPLVLAVVFLIWKGVTGLTDGQAGTSGEAAAAAAAPATVAGPSGPVAVQPLMDSTTWVLQFLPRVEGIPWSAPIYDGREVVEYPVPLCIEVVGERCNCYTQQATKLHVPTDICLRIANEGLFDPYRATLGGFKQSRPAGA